MKAIAKLSKNNLLIIALFLIIFSISLPAEMFAGDMVNYCLIPPYVKRDVKPNIMITMDNSAEMGGAAYCIKDLVDPTICTDNFVPTTMYDGYFESPNINNGSNNQYYCYSGNTWVPVLYSTAIPAGCTTPGIYSGNLLNWATMSKYDLLQRILVGGISTSRITNINTLVGNSTSWTKTLVYTDSLSNLRSCKFLVNSGNLEVTDSTPNSCGYLDTTPHPVVVSTVPDQNNVAASEDLKVKEDPKFKETPAASSAITTEKQLKQDKKQAAVMQQRPLGLLQRAFSIFATVLDYVTPSAEAAKGLAIKIGNPPSGQECVAYSYTFTASGGTTPYSWTHTSGTLPPGLTLVAETGVLSGSPAASGTYNFRLTVTDSSATAQTDYKDYSITISNNTVSITTTSPLQQGYAFTPYGVQLHATGACGSFAWTLDPASPALPAGFSFDDSGDVGVLSNPSPSGATTFTFKARVTDGSNNVATRDFSVTINPKPLGLVIASGSPLVAAQQYALYSVFIEAAGPALEPYTWSISNGTSCANNSLPDGLVFDTTRTTSSSIISGTPSVSGTFCFRITVRDGLAQTATKEFSLTVTPQPAVLRTSGSTAIKICAGVKTATKDINCNNVGASTYNSVGYPCSPTYPTACVMKSGIIDDYWSKARYGLQDWSKQAGVATTVLENCIESAPSAAPDSNFLTAVENAVPIDPTTTLVNGSYATINYFATNTDANCNPFRDATACMKNFNLIISSGIGADNPPTPSGGTPNVYTDAPNCGSANYKNLTKNTCYGYKNDLRTGVGYEGRQYVNTYIVNPMGTLSTPGYDPNDPDPDNTPTTTGDILKQAALKGGGLYYEVTNAANLKTQLIQAFQDILSRAASGTAASVLASGEGSGANLIQAVFYPRRKFKDTEVSWIGRLTNLWYYVDPFFGSSSIFEDNASTRKLNLTDDYKIILSYNSTLERTEATRYKATDTDTNSDGALSLSESTVTGVTNPVEFEKLKGLWEAGLELWKRDIASDKRKIYTTIDGTQFLAGNFSQDAANGDVDKAATLQPYLNLTADDEMDGVAGIDINDARTLIRYVHGEDFSGLRNRTVQADLNNNDLFTDTVTINGVAYNEANPRVWKLGDILNATPKISSWAPLNLYHINNKDTTYQSYLDSSTYQSRGMVFAGGNDGMLHAFKLGTLDINGTLVTGSVKATICNDSDGNRDCTQAEIDATTDIGKEVWAFIPKNVLPYLKYMTKNDYCHLYSIDLTPYVFDASIGSEADPDDPNPTVCTDSEYWKCSKFKADGITPLTDPTHRWRTILIGGMRYGGACKAQNANCSTDTPNSVCSPAANNGYSSYFALDITNQNTPTLLWEFSSPDLGFSTSGPAVVRISARKANAANTASEAYPLNAVNNRWFVVLASGPTGPISTSDNQFMGRSDQDLKIFVLDLKGPGAGGSWTLNSNYWVKTPATSLTNAFAGSILGSSVDTDYDGQDNVMYIPYTQKCAATSGICTVDTWTDGGILRLVTNEDNDSLTLSSTALNPANWALNPVIQGIGPVTASVVNLQNSRKGQLWIYFGSGRYFYENATTTDDAAGQRQLFGLKEPCYSTTGYDPSCTTTRTFCTTPTTSATCGSLTNVTAIANVPTSPDAATYYGWFINLAPYTSGGTFNAERSISNPSAIVSGVVFFSPYRPYQDTCAFGGNTRMWALQYNTGGAPGALQGIVLLQSSTGSIEQINLSQRLTQEGGRATTNVEGKPPEGDPPPLLSSPPAVKRMIHMRER